MRIKLLTIARCLLLFSLISGPAPAAFAESGPAGGKYRIGYLEGGPYWSFTETYTAVKAALAEKGWADRLVYPANAHFSPGWENPSGLAARAAELMARKDLDLIIAMGTAATAAILEANNRRTPILAMEVSDPVKSGFVVSESDSGVDNFTVRMEPGQYRRMIEIFHDVVGFKKLGLIYPDTEEGRQYTNLEDAREVAAARGFAVLEYKEIPAGEETADCRKGIENLIAQGMDAFFIPSLNCFDWSQGDAASLLTLLRAHRIPTFAREGSATVKAGALMGLYTSDFSATGAFLAHRVVRILEGESPRSLSMVDDTPPRISLNLEVAGQIGFDPSFEILGASDELFQEITLPANRLLP